MLPDSTIGPYRVVRRLGQGGMGEVSLAYDSRLKRHVALKSLLPKDGRTDVHADVIREARAAAGLSHPGIAAIFDIIESPDRTFIVMEYVEGQTLATRLAQGSVPWAEALDMGGQLCDAIDAAHRPGRTAEGPRLRAGEASAEDGLGVDLDHRGVGGGVGGTGWHGRIHFTGADCRPSDRSPV
jgi:serine/threonine protein kinase